MDTNNYYKVSYIQRIGCIIFFGLICTFIKGQVIQGNQLEQDNFPFKAIIELIPDSLYETNLVYRQTAMVQSEDRQELLVREPVKVTFKITNVKMIKGADNTYPIVVTLGLKKPDEETKSLNIYTEGNTYTTFFYKKGTYSLSYGNFGVKFQNDLKNNTIAIQNVILASNIYKVSVQISCEPIPLEENTTPYPNIIHPDTNTSVFSKLINTSGNNYIATFEKTKKNEEEGTLIIKYFDDFGKEEEIVNANFTNEENNDVVTFQEYDEWGRKGRYWSPISVLPKSKGGYIPLADIIAQTKEGAYSYSVYEESLEEKVLKTFGDGHDWHINNKCIKSDYFTNKTNNDSLDCFILEAKQNNEDIDIVPCGKYPTGTLLVTRNEDEDGNVTFTFYDMFRRMILQRQLEYKNGKTEKYDTYYIYGMIDKLLAVLPPTLSDELQVGVVLDKELQDEYAFCYLYDELERNIAKKIPGCEWVQMRYDKANQLIFSQDGEEKKLNLATFWGYDLFGRKCLRGKFKTDKLSNIKDYTYCKYNGKDKSLYGYEFYGYKPSNPTILSINYYDGYKFLADGLMASQLNGNFIQEQGYASSSPISQDFLTGTIQTILDIKDEPGINTVIYYDYLGRIAQRKIFNYEYDNETISYAYDFTEKPVSIKRTYNSTEGNSIERYSYIYDKQNRLLSEKLFFNKEKGIMLQRNEYDKLGRISRQTHTNSDLLTTDYSYNNRSWLTAIEGELFNEYLYYQDHHVPTKRYAGRISALKWDIIGQSNPHSYFYNYDQLGRLTSAMFDNNKYGNSVSYEYDKMGNLTALKRNSGLGGNEYEPIDVLKYLYHGNQVSFIRDYAFGPYFKGVFHFVDGADEDTEYQYDANGNMTQDLNKGITNIKYNELNLPKRADFNVYNAVSGMDEERSIEYIYDSEGGKRAVVYTNGDPSIDDNVLCYSYTENRVFENGKLKQILFDGGYITIENDKPQYHFYIQDHQGNNRVVANAKGEVEQINNYYPFGALIGYGYSEDITANQRYKYNGKELDRMFGLDWYDYGARMYDPCIGRWHTIDPMCENYYSISPYAYCANDPINAIDKNGTSIYMLFYGSGYSRIGQNCDDEFKAAAYTRKHDIESSKWFNRQKDIVLVLPLTDIANLQQTVEQNTSHYKKYGKTKEIGIWTHAGHDGPSGSINSSADDIIGNNRQLSINGWSKIDFNWDSDASIGFYGCNTANSEEANFSLNISKNRNMRNVKVYGQPQSAYFSASKQKGSSNWTFLNDKGYTFPRTYLIATEQKSKFWWFDNSSKRMKLYKNGKEIR